MRSGSKQRQWQWFGRGCGLSAVTRLGVAILTACAPLLAPAQALRFSVPDARVLNEFYREGPVAAHFVLTSGPAPRVVIAFPAGNSGVGLWFEAPAPFSWSSPIKIEAALHELPDRAVLRGITAEIIANGGALRLVQAFAGSVRVIRAYQDAGEAPPPEIVVASRVSQDTVAWERRRLDGKPGYHFSIRVLSGAIKGGGAQPLVLTPAADGQLRLRVTATTGDPPLTPLGADELLTAAAAPDARLRNMLAFLSYEEKLLAGSWRFNTYFGRDTLMSLRLLASVLQPRAFEAGLHAVLERLNTAGEVAHEEDIGEYAVLRRLRQGTPLSDAPILDYRMIDDDFMLPVVAAHYLLDTPGGRQHAGEFLARRTGAGETHGAALVRNLLFIVATTTPFARQPTWQHLIALKPGETAGNWRDSDDGLGGGRVPYDVSGVLAPAALEAIARLHASGVLSHYVDTNDRKVLAGAAAMSVVWEREAARLFDIEVPAKTARAEVESYARRIGVDSSAAVQAIGAATVRFRAVALDDRGQPVPILNSDEGVALLFLNSAPADVERIARTLTRPFPAGLLTGAGLVVANPAYAPDGLEPAFGRNRYHGTVVWSWQQALLDAGLERQLGRADLTAAARAALEEVRLRLGAAMAAGASRRGAELWSWSEANGHYRIESFGQGQDDETESNAAQLWSTVHLAPPRPPGVSDGVRIQF